MIDRNSKPDLRPTRSITKDTLQRIETILQPPSFRDAIEKKEALNRLRDIVQLVKQTSEDFLMDAEIGGSLQEMKAAADGYATTLETAIAQIKIVTKG